MSNRTKTTEPAELVDMEFAIVGGATWRPTVELLDTLRAAYPSVNVMDELLKAKAWCFANAAKRKTARGMPRFLNSWMSRQHSDRMRTNAPAVGASRFEPIIPTFDDDVKGGAP